MATPATFGPFNRQYQLAAGQQLQINQNTALYSLIGITYGGDAQNNFKLPDLRGKVIVGADTSGTYSAGQTGGQAATNLLVSQLPPHNFQLVALPVDLTRVTATTTLTGLTGTANLSGVTVSGPPTGLTIKAASSGGQLAPSGNYLGKANLAAGAIYSAATPDGTLNTNSIGGTLSLTIGTGVTAPITVTGTPATVIGGTATVSGATNIVGAGAPVSTMPPYLALTYYIAATNGIYPSRD